MAIDERKTAMVRILTDDLDYVKSTYPQRGTTEALHAVIGTDQAKRIGLTRQRDLITQIDRAIRELQIAKREIARYTRDEKTEDADIAEKIGYPDKWDTAAYPTLASALWEMIQEPLREKE